MPTNIASLKIIELDYTQRGPGLKPGYDRVQAALAEERQGFLRLHVKFAQASIPIIMRAADLYILGFHSANGWWRFSDAAWPLTPTAASLGYDGQYDTLGGLSGVLTRGAIEAVSKLADPRYRPQWKEALRILLVIVAENLRLIPVQMAVLGLLNDIHTTTSLESLARYIRNWGKASQGMDMSVPVRPNLWTGFQDPTIVRR